MTRPDPLVPSEVDLRSLEYMPLYIAQLTRSKTWLITKRKPELTRPLLCLWLASWQSTPAGSIEADDDVLAHACEVGFEQWVELKADLLRGWKLCADGRYYLPAMVPMVERAWALVTGKRRAGKAGAKARWGKTDNSGMAGAMPAAMASEDGREGGRKEGSKERGRAKSAKNGTTHPRTAFLDAFGDLRHGRAIADKAAAAVLKTLTITTATQLQDRREDFERAYSAQAPHA